MEKIFIVSKLILSMTRKVFFELKSVTLQLNCCLLKNQEKNIYAKTLIKSTISSGTNIQSK